MSHILITAGPTREKIDPVRFISNYSTGTFGYEIAKEALRRANSVTLISGPSELKSPRGVKLVRVESAIEMRRAVRREFKDSDCLIMAAAVSDWRMSKKKPRKIKKGAGKRVLNLVENPDILAEIGKKKGKRVLVGFALETGELAKNALKKLRNKGLDFIVANKTAKGKSAFGDKKTDILIIDRLGRHMKAHGKTKKELAKIILDKAEAFNI